MKVLVSTLLALAAANSHEDITKEEFDSESEGKWVFLDMYAEW
jgi:hypothetical protein